MELGGIKSKKNNRPVLAGSFRGSPQSMVNLDESKRQLVYKRTSISFRLQREEIFNINELLCYMSRTCLQFGNGVLIWEV